MGADGDGGRSRSPPEESAPFTAAQEARIRCLIREAVGHAPVSTPEEILEIFRRRMASEEIDEIEESEL